MKKLKVLFLCTENSARSQIAEVLLRHKAGNLFNVVSAGTKPEKIDKRTLKALANFGLATQSLKSKNISNFEGQHFDYVITLCNNAEQKCRVHPWFANKASDQYMSWDFPDPKECNNSDPFTVTLNEINNRLSMFLQIESQKLTVSDKSQPIIQDVTSNENGKLKLDPIAFYKCLTDEVRLKSLMLVDYHGELCVCELMAALKEESQPKISRNLALLRKAKILADRKHGQWVFYRLNPKLPEWARIVLAQTAENNINYITESLQQLALMNDRPDKTRFCCA